jgi:hypothetical protein
MPKTLLSCVLASALSGCVVPVVENDDTASSACHTYTKSMSLKVLDENPFMRGCHDEECLAAALVVSAGSAVISGSIVLTGNTVHWLEYQGTCSDGYLNSAKKLFIETVSKPKPAPET